MTDCLNDQEKSMIRFYKDRFRILLILYFFSEEYVEEEIDDVQRVFKGEIKIQAIDFLVRNPDYLCYELLKILPDKPDEKNFIKQIIKDIFNNYEPTIRKIDMEKFFFGAYEDIDDIIAFLKSRDLIHYNSKRRIDLKVYDKHYYIKGETIAKIENSKDHLESVRWYFDRLRIIKHYFGDVSGTQLKFEQYKHDTYKNTKLGTLISGIEKKVREEYYNIFKENI